MPPWPVRRADTEGVALRDVKRRACRGELFSRESSEDSYLRYTTYCIYVKKKVTAI